jgi:hypothetical protein
MVPLPARSVRIANLFLLLVAFSLLAACESAPVEPPPLLEPSVPSHFTTYTADGGLFSISYPSDWEVPLDLIPEMKEAAVNLFRESITPEMAEDVQEATILFVAGGVKTEMGYNPNVNVIAECTEHATGSLDRLVAVSEQEFKQSVRDFKELSRWKTTLGGHDAIVVEFEYTLPSQPLRCRYLLMIMRAQRSMWFVTCTVLPPLEFDDVRDDLVAVINSLRVLDNA